MALAQAAVQMVLMTKPATLWTKTSKQKLLGGRNGDDMQSFLVGTLYLPTYPKISEGTRIWINHNMNPKHQSRTFWVTSAQVAIFIIFPKELQTKLQQTLGFASSMLGKKQKYSPNSWLNGHLPWSLRIQSYCQRMIGVSNHLLSMVFWWHCHSQRVIGSCTPEN